MEKVKADVHEDGKILAAAKNTKEIQPINDALRVKSTLFYKELYKGKTVYQCGGVIAEYNLSSGIASDRTSLYYAAIAGKHTNDLVRLSANSKSRKVLQVIDIDLKHKRYVNFEFDGKKIKDIHNLTYVNGTKLATKKF